MLDAKAGSGRTQRQVEAVVAVARNGGRAAFVAPNQVIADEVIHRMGLLGGSISRAKKRATFGDGWVIVSLPGEARKWFGGVRLNAFEIDHAAETIAGDDREYLSERLGHRIS